MDQTLSSRNGIPIVDKSGVLVDVLSTKDLRCVGPGKFNHECF
jgi:hypothetical protein